MRNSSILAELWTRPSLGLLLLLLERLVDLPLSHGRVLGDDAVLVHAGQQQQEAHWKKDKVGKYIFFGSSGRQVN